jgi:hypothetical protein
MQHYRRGYFRWEFGVYDIKRAYDTKRYEMG